MIKVITYKEIIENHPELKEEIEELKTSKNAQINGNRALFFFIGLLIGIVGIKMYYNA